MMLIYVQKRRMRLTSSTLWLAYIITMSWMVSTSNVKPR
jgi:hypothetical protein